MPHVMQNMYVIIARLDDGCSVLVKALVAVDDDAERLHLWLDHWLK